MTEFAANDVAADRRALRFQREEAVTITFDLERRFVQQKRVPDVLGYLPYRIEGLLQIVGGVLTGIAIGVFAIALNFVVFNMLIHIRL